MNDQVTKIAPVVEYRSCPGCGWVEAQFLVDAARLSFECPRCRKYSLNDFIPWPPASPTGGKPKRKRRAA